MSRDPNYYLQRADIFKQRSRMDPSDELSDEYEYIPLDEIQIDNKKKNNDVVINENIRIKPQYSRYYDPTTKHYYRTDKILENPDKNNKIKDDDEWFPENQPSKRIIRDPITGQFIKVTKVYQPDGTYRYVYEKINNRMIKRPGTGYYTIQ